MNLLLTVLFSQSSINQVLQAEDVVNACFCEAYNMNVDSKVTEMLFMDKSNPFNHPIVLSTIRTDIKTERQMSEIMHPV